MKYLLLIGALLWAALFTAACGTDKAECGGLINSGTITSSSFANNCANDGSGQAGTTDRHDTTDNHANPGGPA